MATAVTRLHAPGQVKALESAGLSAEQLALLTRVPPAAAAGPPALVSPEPPGFGDGEPFL